MKKWLVLLAVLIILPIGLAEDPVACTEDARLCSDGTSVVRIPPDCEFEACPVEGGIGPDSPFYFLDRLLERVQLALAGSEERRNELHLQFANERLAEAGAAQTEESKKRALELHEEEKAHITTQEEEQEQEDQEGIIVKSDVTVGSAVVDKIAQGYEELNPAYVNKGRNDSS